MNETQQETVVWTLPHLYGWMHAHLDEGHRLSVRTPEDSDHNAGVFACSCGAALDVRPVAASDPTSGLYAVTGPRPVSAGVLPDPAPGGAARVPLLLDRAIVLDRAHQRVRVEFSRSLNLTVDDAITLAAALLAKAAQLETS